MQYSACLPRPRLPTAAFVVIRDAFADQPLSCFAKTGGPQRHLLALLQNAELVRIGRHQRERSTIATPAMRDPRPTVAPTKRYAVGDEKLDDCALDTKRGMPP